ncbi:MAG: Spy/CpxP family protein refolding chaperone [Betaproteobacteria bacterium]|nr:Spy/CpxP family protein refolding chaperone [Betaproteobacteria bacterium]MDE2623137.1 Spy/CpxP family protein refolding chaperone [Betaproteobacteria bacterium]
MMHISSIQKLILIAGSALLLQQSPLWAAEKAPASQPPAASAPSAPGGWGSFGPVDWVGHTERMLGDLKTKLDLTAAQQPAWDTWSHEVLDNVKAQTEKVRHWREAHMKLGPMEDPAHSSLSTPDRMARGLEHMRAEIKRMQDHVALLETALANTKKFYGTLDAKQKTIFDLYWQQSYQGGWIGHGMMGHAYEGHHLRGTGGGY